MLVLTRRTQETLMIGDDVSITVLGIKGNQVRLGINAPESTGVHRKEVYLRIQEEGATPHKRPTSASRHGTNSLN